MALDFCRAIPTLDDPQSKLSLINIEAPAPVVLVGSQNCGELFLCECHSRLQLDVAASWERPAPAKTAAQHELPQG